MEQILRIALPLYFTVYFILTFVVTSYYTAKRIGKSPVVIPKDDSAEGLLGLYFKVLLLALFMYVIVYALSPTSYQYFLPIVWVESTYLPYMGLGILLLALAITLKAQRDMNTSWRIGIDTDETTRLVTYGLFKVSRNPVFLGMILSLVGLFLTTPNAFTTLTVLLGYVLIQLQIRLEEAYLEAKHGDAYRAYKRKVRRLI